MEIYDRIQEIRGTYSLTSPGEEISNETRQVVNVHRSVHTA